MSYDEIFKKWQKSGESKTPGGVKIGIFRFIAVLLFCISTSPLWADDVNSANFKCTCIIDTGFDGDDSSCLQYEGTYNSLSGGTPEQKCNAVDGCKYNSGTDGGCTFGEAGQYTVGGNGFNCSSDSSLYSFAGSYDSNQCFKKLDDDDSSDSMLYNDLPKCKNASGGDVSDCLYYPNIGSNGCVVCPTTGGSEQIGLMNKCTDSINASNYTNQSTDYHIEGTGDNAKCYSNTRDCNLFTTEYNAIAGNYSNYARPSDETPNNTSCIASIENNNCGRTVRGDATWNANNWDVSGCYAERNANDIIVKYGNSNEQNAYCSGVILSKQENTDNPVNNVTTTIKYNYGNYYLCTKCNAGYVVANNAYATDSDTHLACYTTGGSSYTSNSSVYVCKCDPVDPGYYLSSQVQICNYSASPSYSYCKKTLDQLQDLTPVKQPCGPGQTTDGGAASEADCHYTPQTRFCDAHGCFYLSGLSWNADNGYNWGGETNTGQ